MNGVCLHGLLIDLIVYLKFNSSATMPFDVWFTDKSVVGGYDNFVRESAQPGYLKSIGRLSACTNGKDSEGKDCAVAPTGSDPEMRWDYLCGDSPCDLAIGDITISWFRKRVLQAKFTQPFMQVGQKIMASVFYANELSTFSNFLAPFTAGLWWCWLAFLLFSAIAFAVIEDAEVRRSLFMLRGKKGAKETEKSTTVDGTLHRIASDEGRTHVTPLEQNDEKVKEVIEMYTFFSFLRFV